MRCIWQMDGDKVKGFKCDFSPVDMLIIVSGLKYITADIERHPKDRERAQHIYNKIMLSRYEDESQGDDIIVRSNLYPFRKAEQTEPQTERAETMSCQECKWWFTDSLKHGGYCQSLLYNHECRYEPEVDCSWK